MTEAQSQIPETSQMLVGQARQQAYLDFIQSLLHCSPGEEQSLLTAHQDLIDPMFFQVLEQVIDLAVQENALKTAEFLQQIGVKLGEAFSQSLATRTPAYIKLIQTLLTCSHGEEQEILNTHRDLVDAELVEMMAQTSGSLALRGDMDAANFLLDNAKQIAVQLGLATSIPVDGSETSHNSNNSIFKQDKHSSNFLKERVWQLAGAFRFGKSSAKLNEVENHNSEPKPQTAKLKTPSSVPYLLMRLLQITKDSGGNPQIVYPILEANLDQLDISYADALREWATTTLPTVPPDQATGIAADLCNIGNLFLQFPSGQPNLNLEMAIAGYESAITVLNRSTEPTVWAAIQNNLAIAYCDRTLGDKTENLERAIACYQSALEVYTPDAFPQDWAMIQNNLALIYRQRIQGDKAENLERAIAAHQSALTVYTRESAPRAWATTQTNLAQAYEQRIQGNRQENIAQAIVCYQLALLIYTREAFPEQWTTTQQRLTAACQYRDQLQQSENFLTSNTLLTIGEQTFTAPELIPLLARYGFLPQLACEILVEQAIATISCTPEEEAECLSQFHQTHNFQTPEQKQVWLEQHYLTEQQLQQWVTRPLRLEKYQQARWGKQLHSYFIQRKSQLDQVVYSIFRHEEPNLVQEIYFRILAGEQSFAEIAQQYSQGPEAKVGGLIGPVELGSLPPLLAQSLIGSPVGQILNPIQLGKHLAIIRLEKLIPVEFDVATQKRLLNELFHIWLENELKHLNLQQVAGK